MLFVYLITDFSRGHDIESAAVTCCKCCAHIAAAVVD